MRGVFPLKKEEGGCRWMEQHVQKHRVMEKQREEQGDQWACGVEGAGGNGVSGG